MCGIVGVFDRNRRPVSRELLVRMNRQIVHRGPDDDGYWLDGHVGLAMRRLSIIDLAGGKQPMCNEDRQVATVYNGEIYNFSELRTRLAANGHVLRTQCDTEVIPHLYEEKGDAFAGELNGMFAIALWDRAKRRLLLVRDRLGIKPLYYSDMNGQVLFGSELKALVAAGIERRVSKKACFHYMTYGYVPAPLTIYEGVFKLLPGYLAIISENSLETRCYWDVKPRAGDRRSEEQYLEQLDELILDAVRRRLVSDVPLGVLLSGGVDSSLVVAMAARCRQDRIKTFSIGFDEVSHDETRYARAVAKRFSTDHHELVVRPRVAEHFENIILQYDEPFADLSAIPTYFVSQMARKHVTVALSGDGGDEVFAGYHRYVEFFRRRPLYHIPMSIRRPICRFIDHRLPIGTRGKGLLLGLTSDPMTHFSTSNAGVENRALLSGDFISAYDEPDAMEIAGKYIYPRYPSELDAVCMHDLKLYLPDDILTKVDRASMAVSLEVRVPLLDYRIVELAFTLPPQMRLRGTTGKYALKQLLKRYLPSEHVHRRKLGFGVPLDRWFRNELYGPMMDFLSPEAIRDTGLFKPDMVQRMIDMHMTGRWDFKGKLWRVLVAQVWARRFLAGPTVASISRDTSHDDAIRMTTH